MRTISKIIIHCSCSPEGRNDTVEDIRRWHLDRGFADIGYHYVIRLDGTIEEGRPLSKAGAHCQGNNRNSIGICYIGGAYWRDGVNSKGKPIKGKDGKTVLLPKNTLTVEQHDALVCLLRKLKAQFPNATIHGHNEFATKSCPSFNVQEWLSTIQL